MNRTVFLLVLTVFLLSGATAIQALEPYLEFREELKLSEQQVSDLESIMLSLRKSEIRAEANLRVAEIELEELLRAERVALNSVKSKLEKIATLHAEVKFLHIKAEQEAKEVLTEEQRKRFRASSASIHKRIEREIGTRVKEMEERQRDILQGMKKREEMMTMEVKEAIKRMEDAIESKMRRLQEKQEEILKELWGKMMREDAGER